MSIFKKLLIVLLFICSLTLILGGITSIIFFNELSTVLSVEKLDDNVYYADIEGNYYMDDFIDAGGASNIGDLSNFLEISITRGIPAIYTISLESNNVYNNTANDEYDTILTSSNLKDDSILIVKTNPFDRYASISTVNLSNLGIQEFSLNKKILAMASTYLPIDGMNEKGLTATIIYNDSTLETTNTSKVDVTETVMLRMILDFAATADEAKNLLNNYDIYSSGTNNFEIIITDVEGNTIYFANNNFTTKNLPVSSLSDIINETNLLYTAAYNQTKCEVLYYFTKDTSKSDFTFIF